MPVSQQALTGGQPQFSDALSQAIASQLRVALPGLIHSFDPQNGTCSVQPAIKGSLPDGQGGVLAASLPLLPDVPVVFPGGGGGVLTFPLQAGDECLLVFSDRCIDFWWQSGGEQPAVDARMHDLSDAFALVGPRSRARKIPRFSTTSLQLRSDDGSVFIELDPCSQAVNIVAPGGVNVTAPLAQFSQAVTVNGLLQWTAGMLGSIASGVAARIKGAVQLTGKLTSNGKNISDSHRHGGVESGADSTGGVE